MPSVVLNQLTRLRPQPTLAGLCNLTGPVAYEHWLCRISAAEVWGTGRASFAKIEAMGVDTVADLRDLDPRPVRKAMTVVGGRIIQEMWGLSCLPLERVPAQRKDCAVTRSFSSRVEDLGTLEQAVAAHATRTGFTWFFVATSLIGLPVALPAVYVWA